MSARTGQTAPINLLTLFSTGRQLRSFMVAVLAILTLISGNTASLAQRRQKPKEFKPTDWKDDSYYDAIWRRFRIGTPNEKKDVLSELRAVVRGNPAEFQAHFYLGMILFDQGSMQTAERHFRSALAGMEDSAETHYRLALVLLNRKIRTDEAIHHLKQAIRFQPNHSGALAKLGAHAFNQGDFDKALEFLVPARQGLQDDFDLLSNLGRALVEKGRFAESLDVLKIALALNPKAAEDHYYLGRAYEGLGKNAEASQAYESARNLGRRTPETRGLVGYNLARSLFYAGKMEEAIDQYKKAIKVANDPETGWFETARVYKHLGRHREAINAYEKAFSANPRMSEAVFNIGLLLRQDGELAKAIEALERISRRRDDWSEQARQEIEEIKTEMEEIQRDAMLDKAAYGSEEEREKAYLAMLDADRNDSAALDGMTELLISRGDYKEAKSYIRRQLRAGHISKHHSDAKLNELKNLQKDGYHIDVYERRLEEFRRKGDYDKALAENRKIRDHFRAELARWQKRRESQKRTDQIRFIRGRLKNIAIVDKDLRAKR